ncbi:MAG: hypothetical protein HKO53_04595 [Gemmatimonadetes bacterium]|nr:hypothetical protein [Gemmatimonadota bacterium]
MKSIVQSLGKGLHSRMRSAGFGASLVGLGLLGCASGPWPSTSNTEVVPLDHPTVAERVRTLEYQLEAGFRFVAFGDQRAMADGEWQAMMRMIGELESPPPEPPILFVLDTGDIVQDGSHSDQFDMLRTILSPASHLPYVLGVGNHEVSNNEPGPSRQNLIQFLAGTDLPVAPDRLYYRLDLGPMRLICLDTNDLVYGPPGLDPGAPRAEARVRRQMEWLEAELENDPSRPPLTVVSLHHPFVQTSKKHRATAQGLWALEHDGRRLVDILADGGVDVILAGHTHTYERFQLRREDGKTLRLVNLSGRPRNAFLWFGAGSRRPQNLTGETDWFARHGWDLGPWTITQEDVMGSPERNQFGLFTVGPRGELDLELSFLGQDPPHAVETRPRIGLVKR